MGCRAEHLDGVFGDTADFADLAEFLTDLGLRIVYDSQAGAAVVSLNPVQGAVNHHGREAVVVNERVRGGSWTLTPITTRWAL